MKHVACRKVGFDPGVSNFRNLMESGAVYVDKTGFLRELVTSRDIKLMLRPSRFGKTLTLSMIQYFLEMNYRDPEDRSEPQRLFSGLEVARDRELCDGWMGRYPVISISFKEVSDSSFLGSFFRIRSELQILAEKFSFLLSPEFAGQRAVLGAGFQEDLRHLMDVSNRTLALASEAEIRGEVVLVSEFLHRLILRLNAVFRKPVCVLIDEYDVPLQYARRHGYYDEMLVVVRAMLSSALKDNGAILFGMVTGCLRVARESVFTGLNNLNVFGVNDPFMNSLIGLTRDEVQELLDVCGMAGRMEDVAKWYDGYNFAGEAMFCPWSICNFLGDAMVAVKKGKNAVPRNYWVNTSGNALLEICMSCPDEVISERMQDLVDGRILEVGNCEFVGYPDIDSRSNDFDIFATLMMHTGYLTAARSQWSGREQELEGENLKPVLGTGEEPSQDLASEGTIWLRIPNEEVRQCFRAKARFLTGRGNPVWVSRSRELISALFAGEAEKAERLLSDMLLSFISVRDGTYESYYHGFMVAVLGVVSGSDVVIESNTETGNGYSDIQLTRYLTGVILELKKSSDRTTMSRNQACMEALQQIDEQQYEQKMRQSGVKQIFRYGIAFSGKSCSVRAG